MPDASNAVADGNAGQVVAVTECVIADADHSVGNNDASD